jgi:hypothetical protein
MKSEDYEKGWDDAFAAIADYIEEELCMITASMIRRMKYEKWRFEKEDDEEKNDAS